MRIGYFLSSEEYSPSELLRQARLAEESGFEGLWISDHFHPWNDEQGHGSFVWSVIGALAQVTKTTKVTTAVTCPTMRVHPAIIAHAAATAAVLLEGRFALGVGTGEALNEHVLGDRWPPAAERLEMLEEAIAVIRLLWQGGVQSHHGAHYRVDHARVYDLPEQTPPIIVSGFGPQSIALAARIGDGFATVEPDGAAVERFRRESTDGATKLVAAGTKVCWGEDAAACRRTAHRLWPNECLTGELAQILPTPEHFEQACELVTEDAIADAVPCGPDIERQIESFERYASAGFDELYVHQIGGADERFFEVYANEVLPRFGAGSATDGRRHDQSQAERERKVPVATEKQRAAARKNVKKAQQAAASKQTLKHLPAKTRTALGKEANAVRRGDAAPRKELEEEARRLNIRGRSKMGKDELRRAIARAR